MAHQAEKWSISTILANKSRLKSYHTELGLDTSAFNSPRVLKLTTGIKKVHGTKRTARSARQHLTFDVLDSIIPYCDKSFDDTCVKTALCVAFAAFLRGGEFTYAAWTAAEQATKPCRASVTFSPGYATLSLPYSKTDRFLEGTTIKLLETRKPSCPVTNLKDLFNRFPAPGHAPLFARLDPIAPICLGIYFTPEYFTKKMHDLLLRAGIDPTGYTNHSLRRGAAQSAADAGLNMEQIQSLGRWKSRAVLDYLRPTSAAALAKQSRTAAP
jgi:hypothetical protein